MWTKIVAAALVMSGAWGFGMAYSQNMQNIIFHETEQKRMLQLVIREIDYMHRPMLEIFDSISHRLNQTYQRLLTDVSEKAKENNGQGLEYIWDEQIKNIRITSSYSKKAVSNLVRMGQCFGYDEVQLQISAMKLLEKDIEEDIEQMKQEKADKGKLVKTLSMLAGFFILIVFI